MTRDTDEIKNAIVYLKGIIGVLEQNHVFPDDSKVIDYWFQKARQNIDAILGKDRNASLLLKSRKLRKVTKVIENG